MYKVLIITSLLFLVGCANSSNTGLSSQETSQVFTSASNLAVANYCRAHSGSISVERDTAMASMPVIYCTVGDKKLDALKYLDAAQDMWKYLDAAVNTLSITGGTQP